MSDLDQAIAECARHLHVLGIKTSVSLEELKRQLRDDVEQRMKSGLSARRAFEEAVDSARIIERLFVLGPNSRLSEGIVGVRDASRWKAYLEHESQPLLSCPADCKNILTVKRVSCVAAGTPQVAFPLEYWDPEADESLFPEVVTWRLYFRDVHGIEADSTSDLVLALQLAGWSDQRIERYSAIELDGAIDDDSPEYEEHTDKILEFAKAEDVYIGPHECAFALIQDLTRSFPSESPAENVVGRLQLHVSYAPDVDPGNPNIEPVGRLQYEQKGMRFVSAIGELTLTALQELFNTLQSGIRVQFWRDSDSPWHFLPDSNP